MAFDFDSALARVKARLQDDGGFLTNAEVTFLIEGALQQVNHDKPRLLVFDITGDNSQNYALPATFIKNVSDLKTVEVPAGEIPPVFRFEHDDWRFYEDPSKAAGSQLRLIFLTITPDTTETIRATFSTPWVFTSATTTVDNERIFRSIILKSLVECFRALAGRFSQTTDPTISADAVDYTGRSQNFLFLSERYQKDYLAIIGLDQKTKAGQSLREIDIVFSHGEDFVFHSRRTR